MSQINVNEIRDETGSTTIPPNIPGLSPQIASAWVNFNGSGTVAIRDQFNVASITDNGTGNYTINYSSPLANADYSNSGMCRNGKTELISAGIKSTSATQISTKLNSGNTLFDSDDVSLITFGGQ